MTFNSSFALLARTDALAGASARILVVDDQPANIQMVGSILGRLGHEIIPAADGATALKRLAASSADLILLDLFMPDIDGCEVCRRLRQQPEWSEIPVIFLSAADDKECIVRALESGGTDYITKPFNHAELITRVRTQLALKSARDRLARLAEDKDEFLGIVAHDLKSHLGGMQMSAQLLRERVAGQDDPRALQLAENLLRSSSQLLAFVKEYLANAAADHGVSISPARVSVSQAADAAVRQMQEAARRKQLDIRTDFDPENTTVVADATALDQVLDNLLSNALKFSPAGKQIFASVRAVNGHVECRIQDEGPGFTPEDKTRMFGRYVRLTAKPTGGEPSTGLGLSIVQKLVHAMRGELICESAPGAGATFIIRLARAEETQNGARHAAATSPTTP